MYYTRANKLKLNINININTLLWLALHLHTRLSQGQLEDSHLRSNYNCLMRMGNINKKWVTKLGVVGPNW